MLLGQKLKYKQNEQFVLVENYTGEIQILLTISACIGPYEQCMYIVECRVQHIYFNNHVRHT